MLYFNYFRCVHCQPRTGVFTLALAFLVASGLAMGLTGFKLLFARWLLPGGAAADALSHPCLDAADAWAGGLFALALLRMSVSVAAAVGVRARARLLLLPWIGVVGVMWLVFLAVGVANGVLEEEVWEGSCFRAFGIAIPIILSGK